jgi:hypothetical protein
MTQLDDKKEERSHSNGRRGGLGYARLGTHFLSGFGFLLLASESDPLLLQYRRLLESESR